jgi:hypothetical protein
MLARNTLEGPLQLLSVKPTGPVFPIFLIIETAGHSYCVSKNHSRIFLMAVLTAKNGKEDLLDV